MKKSRKTVAGIALVIAFLTASLVSIQAKTIKASGRYITKEISAASFSSIELLGSENVLYSQSTNGKSGIKIYASDNVMDLLDVRVENGVLIVGYKKSVSIWGNNSVTIIAYSPSINNVIIKGSGDVALKSAIKSNILSFKINGSGDITGSSIICDELLTEIDGSGDISFQKTTSKKLAASINGSGDIKLAGESQSARYSVAGSGDIEARNLKSQYVEAKVYGSGDITCHAVQKLSAKVDGSGEINYVGSPSIESSKKNIHNIR